MQRQHFTTEYHFHWGKSPKIPRQLKGLNQTVIISIHRQSLSYLGSHQPAHSPSIMSRHGVCRFVYTQTENKNKSRSQTPAAEGAHRINSFVPAPIHVHKNLMFPSPDERRLILTNKSWSYTCGAADATRLLQAVCHPTCLAIKCSVPLSAPSSRNCSLPCSSPNLDLNHRI